MAADSPFRLLVTLDNRGAAVERIELTERTATGRFRFRDLDVPGGYLGQLALSDEPDGQGCRITVRAGPARRRRPPAALERSKPAGCRSAT